MRKRSVSVETRAVDLWLERPTRYSLRYSAPILSLIASHIINTIKFACSTLLSPWNAESEKAPQKCDVAINELQTITHICDGIQLLHVVLSNHINIGIDNNVLRQAVTHASHH